MHAVLCPTRHEHEREAALVERLLRGTTDGAILVMPSESAEELGDLEAQGFPFVVVDAPMPLPERVPVVSATHWSGARARRPSISPELGHRRIAIVEGREGWVATEDRANGYRAALAGAGVPALVDARRAGSSDRRRLPRRLPPPRPRRAADRDLRAERQHGDRRAPCGGRAGLDVPKDPLRRRLRRLGLAEVVTPGLRPSASRSRRWAAWPSASSRASSTASGSRRCASSSRRGSSCGARPHRPLAA